MVETGLLSAVGITTSDFLSLSKLEQKMPLESLIDVWFSENLEFGYDIFTSRCFLTHLLSNIEVFRDHRQ